MLNNPVYKSRVERLLPRLKGQDQRLADDISVLEICIDFAQVFLHIVRIVQLSKVLPDNSSAGFDIENREIRQNIHSSLPKTEERRHGKKLVSLRIGFKWVRLSQRNSDMVIERHSHH